MPKSLRWISLPRLSDFLSGFDAVVIFVANLPFEELCPTNLFFHDFFIMSKIRGRSLDEINPIVNKN